MATYTLHFISPGVDFIVAVAGHVVNFVVFGCGKKGKKNFLDKKDR